MAQKSPEIGWQSQQANKTYPMHDHLAVSVRKDCLSPGSAPQRPLLLPHRNALRHAVVVLPLAVAGEEKLIICVIILHSREVSARTPLYV